MAAVNDPSEQSPRRAYHSPKREQAARQTRRRIRLAAQHLFLQDGYVPTTMTAIAAEADVAEKTVYLAYATKAALLDEIITAAVRGEDEQSVPLNRGEVWRSILASASANELLERYTEFNATLMDRTARFLALGEAASAIDPALAGFRDGGRRATRANVRQVAAALHAHGALSADLDVQQAADIIYALAANESYYLRLTQDCGWTPAEYAQHLKRALTLLLTHPTEPRS